MARIRSIKPEFTQSESMGRVSREARLLFILLWTICDDAGRTRAASRMLASILYPFDADAGKRIEGWLEELEGEHCIVRYEVDGSNYLQVRNRLIHQKIDRPSASRIPPFDESSRVLATPREESTDTRRGIGSGSGSGSGSGKERKGEDQEERTEDGPVVRVFEYWRETHNHPKARLDKKRRAVIRSALESYTADDLCRCISGYKHSAHHMGQNSAKTVYDDIELFLRDAKHIDAGLKHSQNGAAIQW